MSTMDSSFLTPIGGRLPAETRRSHFGNRAIESSSIHQREAKGECPSTSRERRFHFGKSCGPPRFKASKTPSSTHHPARPRAPRRNETPESVREGCLIMSPPCRLRDDRGSE